MDLISGLPFMLMAGANPQINKTRIVEAVITAAVSGGMIAMAGYYVAFPVLQEQVRQIKSDINDLKTLQKESVAKIESYQLERRTIRDGQQQQTDARMRQIEIELAKRK